MTFSPPKQGWFPGLAMEDRRINRRVDRADPAYPQQLHSLPHPPKSLWWEGRLPNGGEQLIAMVGARAASRAACDKAFQIAHDLGRAGVAIVSGGAFGIDAAAHEGALAAGARTFAVLGCGPDVVYPDRHVDLFARIQGAGGLLSEYAPGTMPRAGQFPARNRIIAALASAVVVVEAAARSGALITTTWASKLGKPLFAIPGSTGTDALVLAGRAVAVTSADDIVRVLAGETPSAVTPVRAHSSPVFAPLLDAIVAGADTPALLCQRLGVSLPSVLGLLAEAEMEGFLRRQVGGIYEVIGRGC